MNLEENKIPEEFKKLAKDFTDNGFITTSFENQLIGLEQVRCTG